MRVVIVTDELFSSRESSLLSRLEVGLVDEGVRVVHAIPERAPSADRSLPPTFARAVTYSPGLALTAGLRAARLARAIARTDNAEEADADIVHAFGGSSWRLAEALARTLGAGLALEVWRPGLIEHAARIAARVKPAPVLLAPDAALERALRSEAPGRPIRLTPWGVHAPHAPREPKRGDTTPTAMIVGAGRRPAAYNAAFEGLARVVRNGSPLMIFLDALAARHAGTWKVARRLGVLPHVSLIEELEARRDLLLQGDLLIQPEASGEQRSIVLEAMATGMLVIAATDPAVSALRDGVTARLVATPDPAAWERAIAELLGERAAAAALARSAHAYVRQERRASDHVRAVLDAYAWMTSGDAIPIRR